MIKLTRILAETKLNRIITAKFQVALEKFLPLLDKKQQAEIILMTNKFLNGVELVNSLPYLFYTDYLLKSEMIFHVEMPSRDLKYMLADFMTDKNLEISLAASNVIKALDEICYVN